jgi:hypothetical protein
MYHLFRFLHFRTANQAKKKFGILLHTDVLGADLTVCIFSNSRPFHGVKPPFSTRSFRSPEIFVRLGQIGLHHHSVHFNTPF